MNNTKKKRAPAFFYEGFFGMFGLIMVGWKARAELFPFPRTDFEDNMYAASFALTVVLGVLLFRAALHAVWEHATRRSKR